MKPDDLRVMPTDNLYKFLALGGLFLVVSSFYLENKSYYETQRLRFAYIKDLRLSLATIDQQKIESDFRGELSKTANAEINAMYENLEKKEKEMEEREKALILNPDDGVAQIREKTRKLEELNVERRKHIEALDLYLGRQKILSDAQLESIRRIQLESVEAAKNKASDEELTRRMELAEEKHGIVKILAGIGSIIGVGMAAFGFLFWYLRTQRYMDIIVAKQAGQ